MPWHTSWQGISGGPSPCTRQRSPREQVSGYSHLETLTSRRNLALAYKEAGDLSRAIPLLETTFRQYEQVLGATHDLRSRPLEWCIDGHSVISFLRLCGEFGGQGGVVG
ncbi:tetratricopeptide repeat protein, partial [Streptomyces aureus]